MFAIVRNYSIMYIQKKIYFSVFSFFLYDPRLCSLKPALKAFMHAQGKFVSLLDLSQEHGKKQQIFDFVSSSSYFCLFG